VSENKYKRTESAPFRRQYSQVKGQRWNFRGIW